MKVQILPSEEVLRGYDAVSALYPHIPSLSHWRAWEYASYRHHRIEGRILDVGCGDGRYFKLIWPTADNVVGVDMDPQAAEHGRASGVYRLVHTAPAHKIPEAHDSFDHAFANCSLEHMDHLDGVLSEIHRCLKPGGTLSCSVVTNRFIDWALLPMLVAEAGYQEASRALERDFLDFHHLANPLTVEGWVAAFERAGFAVELHTPILPAYNSGVWGFMDSLWHVKRQSGGEMGSLFLPFLSANPRFPTAFRTIISGLLEMETDWNDCSGAVFSVRKVR